ncbi:hypothetical protein [Mycobacterium montefiorense]|uniref:hypothetical protein n=1 Tax=Mycobacterium montefiorense TaxID=154654 RepID=UPI0021DD6BF4|nr:hypothetical protein [Mycobacterium montefiorense]MCV7426383.1 hypothetical protein [Mycobacterium montefiorense]GLE53143.1 hypothetical protein ATCCBAA256_27040 [Mycobacterium montefiorense]
MSKPTIGWMDAVNFGMCLAAGFTDIEAHVLETDVRLNGNPMQHTQEYRGNDKTALLAICETNDIAREAQRLEEIQQVTKGEVVKEDRAAENKELADGLNEIAELIAQPLEAIKKRDEQ